MEKQLSVAIITYNEEHIIKRTLLAINDIADEIVIVDSFSTDNTKAICQLFDKVRFFQRQWNGFGEQKNYALSLCLGRWVLFIDADELIDTHLSNSIQKIIQMKNPLPSQQVYKLKLENYVFNIHVKYGGFGGVWRERLFFRGSGSFSSDIVHEKFVSNLTASKIEQGRIKHYTYTSIAHHIHKVNRYSESMSIKMFKSGKRSSLFLMVFSPLFGFVSTYFFHLGFLDGWVGFYLSVSNGGFYTFLKYVKLYNLQKNGRIL